MSDGGKGSARRPKQISDEEEQARWDAIFRKKEAKPSPEPIPEPLTENNK